MKRFLAVLLVIFMLSGCTSDSGALDRGMLLRQKVLSGDGCAFDVTVTADYGDKLYRFGLSCQTDKAGNLTFTVLEPSSIEGISGMITEEGGKLTFDGNALAFELLADGQISPISAPWIFMHTLRSGYIRACEETNNNLHIIIDDSYAEDSLQMDIYTDQNDIPVRAEILWQGRRIVSLDVIKFQFL